MPATNVQLKLGLDHGIYGSYEFGRMSQETVWAISVGADEHSPSSQFKGDPDVPNEDALLCVEEGNRVLLAVADAHFGAESSHEILVDLAEQMTAIPETSLELRGALAAFCDRPARTDYASETTLLVAVFDRGSRSGFGASYGDSSLAVVGSGGFRTPLQEKRAEFVSPARPETFAPECAHWFEFQAEAGDLVLAYTDGLDECHYRAPATSVTPEIMAGLFVTLGHHTEDYVRAIVELALAGVDGSPGGQDNIALVATRA